MSRKWFSQQRNTLESNVKLRSTLMHFGMQVVVVMTVL
jgi:hypothetical protein